MTVDTLVGADLDGRYRIMRLLGRGGMGAVYEGVQLSIGRPVAIKLLRIKGEPSTKALQRFALEARAVGRLEHPNVVRVYDYGITDDGTPYLVMELLAGRSLSELLKSLGGLLPIGEAVRIVAQAARGLAAAHRRGIVHRDIKPGNIWIEPPPERTVRVIDFGMAFGGHWPGSRITATGLVVGTPAYMSPEQAEGAAAYTPAADVYALGLLLFRLVVGHNPFARPTVYETLLAQVAAPVPDLTATDAGKPIPEALADVWFNALAKWPDDRYPDADAFRHALLALHTPDRKLNLTSGSVLEESSPPPTLVPVPMSTEETVETGETGGTRRSSSGGERKLVTALALVLEDANGAALDRCAEVMASFGGACINYVPGYGVRALFGMPAAREDDAHRALLAALAVRALLTELGAGLEARLGLHTHAAGGDPYRVAGDAAAGGLGGDLPVLTAATVRTLRRSLSGDLRVVGAVGEEVLYALTDPADVRAMGHGVVQTVPMLGRDALLAELCGAARDASFKCRAAYEVIRGEAGIGKSRVLRELEAALLL